MAKYIDVDDLFICYSGHTPDDEFSKGVDFVLDKLDEMPGADVRPVVFCKDCMFSYYADNRVPAKKAWACSLFGMDTKPDGFCYCGEKKNENTDGS